MRYRKKLSCFLGIMCLGYITVTEAAPDASAGKVQHVNSALQDRLSAFWENNYYYWKDDVGNSGYQFIQPYTFTFKDQQFEYGLRTAYIVSENKSANASGRVAAWSDTALSVAYANRNEAWPVRYNLDLNLPTGKATLTGNQKYAIMDNALVQQTRLGEGFNITPGVNISRQLGPNDLLGFGTSYTVRGKYDPNGDIENDVINPGNEWINSLQWQHIEKNWLFIGGFSHTGFGITKRAGADYYQKGKLNDVNMTYVTELPRSQSLMLNYRYSHQEADQYQSILGGLAEEPGNSNGDSQYISATWSKSWDDKQTVRLMVDLLKTDANSYDPIDDFYIAGRTKHGGGIGYDVSFTPHSRLSVDVKKYTMRDKATVYTGRDTRYDGWNVYTRYSYEF